VLNARITYLCDEVSKKTGGPAERVAGVPKPTFDGWRNRRNFLYSPPADLDKAVEERMALDGFSRTHRTDRDGRLLTAIADVVAVALRLAATAHGAPPSC